MPAVKRRRSAPSQGGKRPTQKGLTLAELAVVLALLGIIGSMIGITLVRQQRFYRGATELLRAREEVRDAAELLSADIRGMSVFDTVRLLADSAIEFFANVGSSVVCEVTSGIVVALPGASSRPGNTLTAFLAQPDTGDIAVFYGDSLAGPSQWERHRITGFSVRTAATCPASSAFARETGPDAGGRAGFLLELSNPLSPHVRAGAPVRFIRRGRYSLYRASDGSWYLGYRRCNSVSVSACGAIQPLSGPYRAHNSDPRNTGLLFEYFDESGRRLTPGASPLDLARVDITARSEGRQRIVVEGRVNIPADSATVAISIRNRSP